MATVRTPSDEVRSDIQETLGRVPEWVNELPQTALPPFWSLMKNFQLGETRIPNKYKELIGLAVSGATRCRYCALFHTEAARLNGATDEEIAEASLMGGFTMMASTFLNAQQADYDSFKRETLDIVAYVKAQAGKTPQASPAAHADRV
ncbi:MAG: carboxymuconolactone decarboxylase family protein [Deltaproteobacteria bacterium]|nr:carboxymuconolactone decarboxylase family protein [Deltaproteobacteria bacterium]